jgi:hypothetical protein
MTPPRSASRCRLIARKTVLSAINIIRYPSTMPYGAGRWRFSETVMPISGTPTITPATEP